MGAVKAVVDGMQAPALPLPPPQASAAAARQLRLEAGTAPEPATTEQHGATGSEKHADARASKGRKVAVTPVAVGEANDVGSSQHSPPVADQHHDGKSGMSNSVMQVAARAAAAAVPAATPSTRRSSSADSAGITGCSCGGVGDGDGGSCGGGVGSCSGSTNSKTAKVNGSQGQHASAGSVHSSSGGGDHSSIGSCAPASASRADARAQVWGQQRYEDKHMQLQRLSSHHCRAVKARS